MGTENILKEILENLDAVAEQSEPVGAHLWQKLQELHPVSIAQFMSDIPRQDAKHLFVILPEEQQKDVFRRLSVPLQIFCLSFLDDHDRISAMHALTTDELTDLFDDLSDDDLKKYLVLLNQNVRHKVLSQLQFAPESVGKIMDIDVPTLMHDFTVEKSIKLLHRLLPDISVQQQLYVTNRADRLEGHINLEDLILHKPKERIASFVRPNELVVHAQDDQEETAKQMVQYGLMSVPVVDEHNHFLGVIPGDTLIDVIMEESTEDVQRMAALQPLKESYFDTPTWRLFYQRSYILVILLVAESLSSHILSVYEATLTALLLTFIPMLISTGGNTSSQTSAVVIQSMASGELTSANTWRFLCKELRIAAMLAGVLAAAALGRVYLSGAAAFESIIIAITVFLIVVISAALGSTVPLLLRRFNIDPAFSAGPFLATVMDVIGVMIFCYVSKLLLA